MIKNITNLWKFPSNSWVGVVKVQYFSTKNEIFTVSLIGRPNVGKSSLFKKLSGGEFAITDPSPGLTRDRKEFVTKLLGFPLRVIDTAGIENTQNLQKNQINELYKKMEYQTNQALLLTNLSLFMIDFKQGVTHADIRLAKYVQDIMEQQNKSLNNVILIVNKCEKPELQTEILNDIHQIGFGDPLFISAEQGDGLNDLFIKIIEKLPQNYIQDYEELQQKRLEKHNQIKKQQIQEIRQMIQEEKLDQDFDI